MVQYIGLPFVKGGRGPVAVDCWGLTRMRLVYAHGITNLPMYDDCHSVETAIAEAMQSNDWAKVEKPKAGDVVVMVTPVGGGRVAPLHVGVMMTDTHVLNIDEGHNSVCLSLQHPLIAHRIDSFYRHKDLN